MPSINSTIEIHANRRLRINTCEGHVSIADENRIPGNRWQSTASISVNREQAAKLIEQLSDQMAKNF
jgi:hypothetical protein